MGKWQFKRTPFGLSQAPAYCQLLIDKVLRYPDPTQSYILYTDASGIGWSGVLTQEHR